LVLFLWERHLAAMIEAGSLSPTKKNLLAGKAAPIEKLVRVAALFSVQAPLSGNGCAKSTPALLT
jgi:hypothetical protein